MASVTYLDQGLVNQVTDMVLLLKEWQVNNAYSVVNTESYGDKTCDCCYRRLFLASRYINIMECYTFPSTDDSDPYNCITEDELRLVMQNAKKITLSDC